MDLNKLLNWLHWQMMSKEQQLQMQQAMEQRARQMNEVAPRSNGNISQQGLNGIFSDSLPFTPRDQFQYKHPGLADILNRFPQETPPIQKQPYQGML